MKKKALIFSAILVDVIVTAYSIWFFIGFSNASSSQDNYLERLESKSEVVIEHFRDKNIISDYSAQSHTFIVKEKDITYSFTDDGLSEIDTKGAIITINDLSKDGKVKVIDISYGDVKKDDVIIKKALLDSKIQEYVNQGEQYQTEIKRIILQ